MTPYTHVELVTGGELRVPIKDYHRIQRAMLEIEGCFVGVDLNGANYTVRVSDISLVAEITQPVLDKISQPEWMQQ